MLAYTGKVLNYILAVPALARRRRVAAGARVRQRGLGVRHPRVRGALPLRRPRQLRLDRGAHHHPPRSVDAGGRARSGPRRHDRGVRPRDRSGVPPGALRRRGTPANTEQAVGEIVNTAPGDGFEGYYRNEEAGASKIRGGIYWSGDLAYRDDDGWFFFAGRSNEWLRVDGENFAAAPVERIVLRHPRCGPPRSTRCPTTRSATGSWSRSRSTTSKPSTSRSSTRSSAASRDLGHEVVAQLRPGRGRAPEARQHEDRQDASATRRLARIRRLVATRPRRGAAAADRGRPRRDGAPPPLTWIR